MVKLSTHTQSHVKPGQMTLTQGAKKAGVEIPTIYSYFKHHHLWMAKMGRHTLVKEEDVDAYIATREKRHALQDLRKSLTPVGAMTEQQNGHDHTIATKPVIRVVSTRPHPEQRAPVVDITRDQIAEITNPDTVASPDSTDPSPVMVSPSVTIPIDGDFATVREKIEAGRREIQNKLDTVSAQLITLQEECDLHRLVLEEFDRQEKNLAELEKFLQEGTI